MVDKINTEILNELFEASEKSILSNNTSCTRSFAIDRLFLSPLPNKFKKNDSIKFKYKKKTLTGKIIKIGGSGVDVKCNSYFYYCSEYNELSGVFEKSNVTRNYT